MLERIEVNNYPELVCTNKLTNKKKKAICLHIVLPIMVTGMRVEQNDIDPHDSKI